MKLVSKINKKGILQFLKFGIVGGINTVNSWIIYYGMIYFNVNYLISSTFAYFISSIIGYFLNKQWVFKSRSNNKNSLVKYYIVYISSYFLNIATMYLLVDIFNISKYIAPILTLCITVPYNYLFSKSWIFKRKKDIKYTHTFAIVAYKESPYLEECVKSVVNQSVKSNVIISTSTPNNYIKNIAKKYKIKVYNTKSASDIQDDWNYAYNSSSTDLVTITHQDDVYDELYLENILHAASKCENFKMIQTDYLPLKNGKYEKDINSSVKKLLKLPLRLPIIPNLRFFKVASLAFGNTVNCPSVVYNKNNIEGNVFTSDLKFSLDWDTFLKLCRQKGKLIYIPKNLVYYRIHEGATTKEFIVDKKRETEDIIMFSKIWPKFIVKIIMRFYTKSYDTYN